jgi:hypothetical protein
MVLQALPDDLSKGGEAVGLNELDVIKFSARVQDMGIQPSQAYAGKNNLVVEVKLTDKVKTKHTGKIFKIYYAYSMPVQPNSHMALLVQTLDTRYGTTRPSDVIGQEVIFEKLSLEEHLPDYRPPGNGGEKYPRFYPTEKV